MAIEIPHEVALFLNFCGVQYPDVNEDDVRTLGRQVQNFAAKVQNTHESATGVIKEMGSVYSGYSYEQLLATWGRMSATHMADLDAACTVVAKALDLAADVITVVKVAVLAELAALAASYAAIIATPAGPAAGPSLAAAARRICDQMAQNLLGYLVAEVIGKAIEPLEHTIDRMINGVAYDAASHLLGVSPPSSSSVSPLHIEPDEVLRYAKVLDDHADEIMRHAADFADEVAKLDFTTDGPDGIDGPSTPAVPTNLSRVGTDPGMSSAPKGPLELPRGIAGPWSMERPALDAGHSPAHLATADRASPSAADLPERRYSDSTQRESYAPVDGPQVSHGGYPNSTGPMTADTRATTTAGSTSDSYPGRAEHGLARLDGTPRHGTTETSAEHASARPDGRADRITAAEPVRTEGRSRLRDDTDRREHEFATGLIASDSQAGPYAQQPSGQHNPSTPTTPWARSEPAPAPRATPSKPLPSSTSRPPTARSVERSPLVTPWSKTKRTPNVSAEDLEPNDAGPTRRHNRSFESDRDTTNDIRATDAKPDSRPPRASSPALYAPDNADQRRRAE
ncbi:WXG100-like domain-containing protein [Nocardia sp. NPDC004278]